MASRVRRTDFHPNPVRGDAGQSVHAGDPAIASAPGKMRLMIGKFGRDVRLHRCSGGHLGWLQCRLIRSTPTALPMKHTYSAAIRIALHATLCITCVVSFSGCSFGSHNRPPPPPKPPQPPTFSLSPGDADDWRFASDAMTHRNAPQVPTTSGTMPLPPVAPPPPSHAEVK
jgi:hypothetical protein